MSIFFVVFALALVALLTTQKGQENNAHSAANQSMHTILAI